MQNKIFFFGDSFTYGYGCDNIPEYKPYKKEGDKIWPELVAESLGCQCENRARPVGNSIPYLLHTFITTLGEIQEGDKVVISNTLPESMLVLDKTQSKVSTVNIRGSERWDRIFGIERSENFKSFIDQNFLIKEPVWETFFQPQFQSIALEILNREVETYFWSYRTWYDKDRYETIKMHTKGEIDDYHWSWNGHREFSKHIIKRIQEKDYIKPCLI